MTTEKIEELRRIIENLPVSSDQVARALRALEELTTVPTGPSDNSIRRADLDSQVL